MNAHHFDVILRKVCEAITRPDTTFRPAISAELGQLASRVTKMLNCDWSVDATGILWCLSLAHISNVDQMTAQTGLTEVDRFNFLIG